MKLARFSVKFYTTDFPKKKKEKKTLSRKNLDYSYNQKIYVELHTCNLHRRD